MASRRDVGRRSGRALATLAALTVAAGCTAASAGSHPASTTDSTIATAPVATALIAPVAPPTQPPSVPPSQVPVFTDTFDGENRLITNEYAFNNPGSNNAVVSDSWEVTSGSMFVRDGAAWTGLIDDVSPDPQSAESTNSAVFRAFTRVGAPASSTVTLRLLPITFVNAVEETPWDGAHVLVRVQNEQDFYAVSMVRRDGSVVIKRKVPGGPSNGGTYVTLADVHAPLTEGDWHDVRIVTYDRDGAVVIELWLDGANVLTAVDSGQFGPPLTEPGTVGFRADNFEVSFDDLVVS